MTHPCTFHGCVKPAYSRYCGTSKLGRKSPLAEGHWYCKAHYAQLTRHGILTPLKIRGVGLYRQAVMDCAEFVDRQGYHLLALQLNELNKPKARGR